VDENDSVDAQEQIEEAPQAQQPVAPSLSADEEMFLRIYREDRQGIASRLVSQPQQAQQAAPAPAFFETAEGAEAFRDEFLTNPAQAMSRLVGAVQERTVASLTPQLRAEQVAGGLENTLAAEIAGAFQGDTSQLQALARQTLAELRQSNPQAIAQNPQGAADLVRDIVYGRAARQRIPLKTTSQQPSLQSRPGGGPPPAPAGFTGRVPDEVANVARAFGKDPGEYYKSILAKRGGKS
jgi:hypothetical protein